MNILRIVRHASYLIAVLVFFANTAFAEELPYSGPTVEDNVALMDIDKNGFADVHEVRAFLESKHGKEYEREMFDRWESTSTSKSCGSSFSKSLY